MLGLDAETVARKIKGHEVKRAFDFLCTLVDLPLLRQICSPGNGHSPVLTEALAAESGSVVEKVIPAGTLNLLCCESSLAHLRSTLNPNNSYSCAQTG